MKTCKKCKTKTIRKFCSNCGEEQKGDFFKCACCGEKTLEGYETTYDLRICGICSGEI